MIIDTHAHFTPQSMLDALKKDISRFPNMELLNEDDKWQLVFSGGKPTRPISPKLRDTDKRLEWMAEQKIDVQVAGGWLDSFGYELPGEEGETWSRMMNEYLLSGSDGVKGLVPLATVPLQDGKRAARVLEDALNDGFKGVMLGTQPHGDSGNLDDPDLDPFWEAAASLKATIFMHPMFGCGDPRYHDYGLMNGVARGIDTTTAMARLLFSGHFLKYTGFRMIVSHGGGTIPWLLGRLKRNYDIHDGQFADPVAGFQTLYFDTVLFEPDALDYLCKLAGHEKVVLGSDYPFPIGDLEPAKIVENADLSADQKQNILGTTAADLFQINQ